MSALRLALPRNRYLLYGLLCLLTTLVLALTGMGDTDYRVFHTAGQRWRTAADLYPATDGHYAFKYFPSFALLQAPFGLISYHWAVAIWIGTVVLGGTFLLYEACHRLSRHTGTVVGFGLLAWVFLILLKHTGRELVLGQANIVSGLLLLLAVEAQLSGKPTRAGLWAGLAVAVKPYAIILLLYWLVRRQWRATVIGLLVFGAILLLALLRYPLADWLLLWQHFAATTGSSTQTLADTVDNASMLGAATQWFGGWFGPGTIQLMALLLLAALAALFLPGLRKPYTPRVAVLETAALTVFLVLAAPQGWYYLICAAPMALLCVLQAWPGYPRWMRMLLILVCLIIGATYYDVFMPFGGRAAYHAFLTSGLQTVAYTALVVALAWQVRSER